jgi:hypothetical protein
MTILVILIILIAIICGILAYQKMDREGFDLGPNTELSTCPLQSKAYLAKNGDTLCCETSLSPEGICAKPLCALAHRKDMPSCKAMLDAANQKAASICPPSLPNYYTDGKAVTGCTDGALNNERTAPVSSFSKTCKVYPNTPLTFGSFTANDVMKDSCSLQRRLEITKKDMKTLFGSNYIDVVNNSIKYYVSFKNPTRTTPDACETKENLIYVAGRLPLEANGVFNPTEAARKDYIKLIKEGLAFDCATAKAIYIDKSMTKDDVLKKRDAFRAKNKN